jgi:hypothetical protein
VPPEEGRPSEARRASGGVRSPPDVVTTARDGGVVFTLSPDYDLFTIDWRGPYDRRIDEAIRDNYDEILAWLIREAEGHPRPRPGEASIRTQPPAPALAYTVLGPAPAGERCSICGDARPPRPVRIKRGAEVMTWHERCAAKYVAATMPEASAGFSAPAASAAAASVAFMITKAQKAALRDLGLTDDDIANLTPPAAHEILAAAESPKMETNDGP